MTDPQGGIGDPGEGLLMMLSMLRTAGPPDRLDDVADIMESFEEPGCASTIRALADEVRQVDAELRRVGIVYDFEGGAGKFPTVGRGPGVDMMTLLISAAFTQLDIPAKEVQYNPRIYDAVRAKLVPFLDAEGAVKLTDDTIRRAIERRRK